MTCALTSVRFYTYSAEQLQLVHHRANSYKKMSTHKTSRTMETEYQQFDGSGDSVPKGRFNAVVGLLVFTCLLFIAAVIVAAVVGTKAGSSSSSSSSSSYCTTTSCLELAADLSKTINSSVDPCHDFYHYVCDGWDDENSWINIMYPQYGTFNVVPQQERDTFIDALFYNTKESLVGYPSVANAQAFFSSCYASDSDMESLLANEFVQLLVNETTFYDPNSGGDGLQWTEETRANFQQSLAKLTQLDFNPFFSLSPAGFKMPIFTQFFDFWTTVASINISQTLEGFVPLYQEILGLDANESADAASAVGELMLQILNITTIFDPDYQSYDTLIAMLRVGLFSNLSTIFEPNALMNYSQLVYDVYSISPSDPNLLFFQYLSGGVPFFQDLPGLLEKAGPKQTQYFITTAVFYYYLNFQDTLEQSRYTDRTDFCIEQTIDKFPFVYGYILFNTLYDDEAHELASTLASEIKTYGTQVLIESSEWLDDKSKAAALKKVENMALYIGFPPRVKDPNALDIYYRDVSLSDSYPWVANMELFTMFDFEVTNQTFWGYSYNLTAGWPSDFDDSSSYDSWLTNVNAFYTPLGNWFTIPASISQPPFLISDPEYPSSLTFGGLGVVCGHEMSHGFDPSGSQYNYNGTYVGSIFTNESQLLYADKMTCFKKQYSSIVVDHYPNGQPAYDNGTRTITENVADNAGLLSSWTAWQNYLDDNGDDDLLYGVDMSQEQLFFVGFARLWCETDRPGSSLNWTDVHSPNYARVIGTLQNSQEFADAFNCASGSRMNPANKCSVW